MASNVPLLPYVRETRAMSITEADDNDDSAVAGGEPKKRSERKRQREKQRRFDLSNAFDELAAFIVQVEPEAAEADLDGKKKRRKSEGEDSSGITRLDLIGRALQIMKRLHHENEERKAVIANMRDRGGPNEKVMVMVPTLAPVGEDHYPVARASYPASSYGRPPTNYYQPPHSLSNQPPPSHPSHMQPSNAPPAHPQPPHQPPHAIALSGPYATAHSPIPPGQAPQRPPTEYHASIPPHASSGYPPSGWNRYGAPPPLYHGQQPSEQGPAHGMVPASGNRGPPTDNR